MALYSIEYHYYTKYTTTFHFVIPAKAGIQSNNSGLASKIILDPGSSPG